MAMCVCVCVRLSPKLPLVVPYHVRGWGFDWKMAFSKDKGSSVASYLQPEAS